MPELPEADRERLARLRHTFGEVDLPPTTAIEGAFGPIDPMLAGTLDNAFDRVPEEEWLAETKYDGTRLILEKFDGEFRAYTRRGIDRADAIPAVIEEAAALRDGVILDGELTFLTPGGVSEFLPIHTGHDDRRRRELTAVLFAFDVLYDDADVTAEPLTARKDRLADLVPAGDRVRVTPFRTEGFPEFYREVTDAGEEGLIIKRRDSRYYPGVRSRQWLKVKRFTERDAIAVGVTAGEGARADTFGALVLSDGERCIGRVGSGFTEDELAAIAADVTPIDRKPFPDDEAGMPYTPVEPFVVAVKYQAVTDDGKLRAPVFLRRRPDKPIDDVQRVG